MTTGLDEIWRDTARAKGWPWCDEHERPRFHGADPCAPLHEPPPAPVDEPPPAAVSITFGPPWELRLQRWARRALVRFQTRRDPGR